MEDYDKKRLERLDDIEDVAKESKITIQYLREDVSNLQNQVSDFIQKRDEVNSKFKEDIVSLDKDNSIQDEKLNSVLVKIGDIERRVSFIEEKSTKSDDGVKDMLNKLIMAIIGGILTYLFNLLN